MELLKIEVCGNVNGVEVMESDIYKFFLLYHIMIRSLSRAQLGTYHKEGPSRLRSIVGSLISFLSFSFFFLIVLFPQPRHYCIGNKKKCNPKRGTGGVGSLVH